MFKLPVCPHCRTIYRYKDVKKEITKKECCCYHCGKKFRVSKKKILVLFLTIAVISSVIDIFALNFISGLSFIGLMIVNVIILTVGFFLIPFCVSFVSK